MVGLLDSPGVIPAQYAVVGFGTAVLLGVNGALVSKTRKEAKVPYPIYMPSQEQIENSPAHKRFACAQRAHANTVENLPFFLPSAVIFGARWPILGAALYGIWLAGRIVYSISYVNAGPKARARGFFNYIGGIPIIFGALYVAVESTLYGR